MNAVTLSGWSFPPVRPTKKLGVELMLSAAASSFALSSCFCTVTVPRSLIALLTLTLPISTAVLAFIFLGERMSRIRWASFALAIAGVLLCSGIDFKSLSLGGPYLVGNALIFFGILGSAFYNSYGKKVLERYSPMEMLFFTYVAMFVIMTPLVLVKEREVFSTILHFTLRTWTGLALLTFFHNYLSMVLFLKALKHLDAIQAALSNYLITFFGVPIAALWLGEKLTLVGIIGGIMILLSTLLITVAEERQALSRRAAVLAKGAANRE